MTLVRERAQTHGIALGSGCRSRSSATIDADERKFKQILLNLLSNAVKFTPDGGRIDVSARRDGDNVVIAVHDTGIGIAPEDQAGGVRGVPPGRARLHQQAGRHRPRPRADAQVRRAARGRIWLESEPGKGSTFTFTIPMTAMSVDPDRRRQRKEPEARARHAAGQGLRDARSGHRRGRHPDRRASASPTWS